MPSKARNVVKPEVNPITIETESENEIFLFIPFTPCVIKGQTFGFIYIFY